MTEIKPVMADKAKLQAVLAEKGLPSKINARLNQTEQKIHDLLCVAYNFTTGFVGAEIPAPVLQKCGTEFRKIWNIHPTHKTPQGKTEVLFSLTPTAIKTTIKTVMTKDSGIFTAKNAGVPLHDSWGKFLKPRDKTATRSADNIDWAKAEKLSQRRNDIITRNINDGKTFNAQKDNAWARKNLKNKGN